MSDVTMQFYAPRRHVRTIVDEPFELDRTMPPSSPDEEETKEYEYSHLMEDLQQREEIHRYLSRQYGRIRDAANSDEPE